MSRENVEVRRAYDEFLAKGELPLPLCHPEIRVDNIAEVDALEAVGLRE